MITYFADDKSKEGICFQMLIYFSGQNEIMQHVAQTQNEGREMHLILSVSVPPVILKQVKSAVPATAPFL